MFPSSYFALFPAFPRQPVAFVAMSFDARFQSRWENVLSPALQHISHNKSPLRPFRVDLGKASDAILTEILQNIADATVIGADITAHAELDGRPIRNANVLYEVGIAHAVRFPEEVVLFRSDTLKLDFDVAGVRVHSYDPDANPTRAMAFVTDTVIESLRAMQERARISIRWASERLTLPATFLILELMKAEKTIHPPSNTMGDLIGGAQRADAIALLLGVGALRSTMFRLTPELLAQLKQDPNHDAPLVEYVLTPFGKQLGTHLLTEMGAFSDGMREFVEATQTGRASTPSAS